MKELTLVPFGGLANRLLTINSAIAFCRDNNTGLRIFWFKDWGMGAGFHDLFTPDASLENVRIIDARWYHFMYDRPRKKNLWIPYPFQYICFDKRIYEHRIFRGLQDGDLQQMLKSSHRSYLAHCFEFYKSGMPCNPLLPAPHISERINEYRESLTGVPLTGIHIRRTDNSRSIQNSPLSLFIEKIQEEIAKDDAMRFYVASDSAEDKEALCNRFGSKIITSFKPVRRDTGEGITDALVEMYILAGTQKIYGSSASTFSMYAARINNTPLEILSIKHE